MADWAAMVENRDSRIAELEKELSELSSAVVATMTDPREWARESSILLEYVRQWTSVHVSQRADCNASRHGGLHCLHFQEGDGCCCDCARPNWAEQEPILCVSSLSWVRLRLARTRRRCASCDGRPCGSSASSGRRPVCARRRGTK